MEHKKRIIVKRQTDYIDEKDIKNMKNVIYSDNKYMLPASELLKINDESIIKSPNLICNISDGFHSENQMKNLNSNQILSNDIKKLHKSTNSLNSNQESVCFNKNIVKNNKIENEITNNLKDSAKNKDKLQNSKTTNIHKSHRSRLKFQFNNFGLESLNDIQKLELLLFYSIPLKDTNPIAHELLKKFGTLKDVFDASISDLTNVKGVKENTATLIKLTSSLFKCISIKNDSSYISSVSEAKDFCSKLFNGVEVEQFYIICLSKSNRVKNVKLVQSGSTDEIMVQIRNVTEFALDSKCNRIIITHNHPCGFGKMSDEDCKFTFSLICSCILNSIDIVDHIIVGTDKTISLASQNVLPKLKEKAVSTIHLSQEKIMKLSNFSINYNINK